MTEDGTQFETNRIKIMYKILIATENTYSTGLRCLTVVEDE
jgi:hypothetical protein